MARSRNIKPGFFQNDELCEIDPLGRLLFAGLWTLADRAGRLEDRPKKIKACVLPYDNCDVDKLLNKLNSKFIFRYKIDNQPYIQILNWVKHQNPHIKEPVSEIPAPDLHQINTIQEQDENGSSPADSLNLIPDSLNLIPIYAKTIFEHWNDQNITKHKKMSTSMKSHIEARLNDGYELQDILDAISNYAVVLSDNKYFWSYKWTLGDFMNPKNIDRFLTENNPFDNFTRDNKDDEPPQGLNAVLEYAKEKGYN